MASENDLVVDQGLTIRTTHEVEVFEVKLWGDLDMENAPTLDSWLAKAEDSDAKQIVLDLRELGFIDSSGLKSILTAVRRSQMNGHRLGILRGDGQVAKLLELTGIDISVNVLD
jgi:anti-anti-sigma factor